MRPAAALALAALLAAACSRPAQVVPDTAAQQEPHRVVGRVAVVGSAPVNLRVAVRTDAGGVYVEGPLAAEVRRLSGAQVEVWGRRDGDVLRAEGYRVVSVDGAPVWQGTVERGPGGGLVLRLADGNTLALDHAPPEIRPGQKVWVQGPTHVGVQTFGIVTSP
ncbi:MAG TPA: hypothetical protein VFX98_16500 [Longimicrobiaceae bacterium]|nr:hypothetical protein [Longimicrobiaceae bacterium]